MLTTDWDFFVFVKTELIDAWLYDWNFRCMNGNGMNEWKKIFVMWNNNDEKKGQKEKQNGW